MVKLRGSTTLVLVVPACPTFTWNAATAFLASCPNEASTPPRQQLAMCMLGAAVGRRSMTTGFLSQQWGRGSVWKCEQSPWNVVWAPTIVQMISPPPHAQLSFHPGKSMCRYCCQLNIVTVAYKTPLIPFLRKQIIICIYVSSCCLEIKVGVKTHEFFMNCGRDSGGKSTIHK